MRVVALIVMFCVLLQGLSKGLLLIRYQLNKKYYSEILCSNKGLVVIDCEGKCRLLKEVEDEERRSTHIPGFEKIDFSSLPPAADFSVNPCEIFKLPFTTLYFSHLLHGWVSLPHKPPRRPVSLS